MSKVPPPSPQKMPLGRARLDLFDDLAPVPRLPREVDKMPGVLRVFSHNGCKKNCKGFCKPCASRRSLIVILRATSLRLDADGALNGSDEKEKDTRMEA